MKKIVSITFLLSLLQGLSAQAMNVPQEIISDEIKQADAFTKLALLPLMETEKFIHFLQSKQDEGAQIPENLLPLDAIKVRNTKRIDEINLKIMTMLYGKDSDAPTLKSLLSDSSVMSAYYSLIETLKSDLGKNGLSKTKQLLLYPHLSALKKALHTYDTKVQYIYRTHSYWYPKLPKRSSLYLSIICGGFITITAMILNPTT